MNFLYQQYAKSYVCLFTSNELDENSLESLNVDKVHEFYNENESILRMENIDIPIQLRKSKYLVFMIYCGARRLFQKVKMIRSSQGHSNH